MPPILVLATRNKHKAEEYRTLFEGLPVELRTLEAYSDCPEVEETGETFFENASIKARAVMEWTGLPALADDSGLEVDALGGAPGVRSARFAGEPSSDPANNAKLLQLLAKVPSERRCARFRCVITLAFPGGREESFDGTCSGTIGFAPSGAGGFGYDPLFIVQGLGKTMAELSMEEKNSISHRGRAMQALKEKLPRLWETAFTVDSQQRGVL